MKFARFVGLGLTIGLITSNTLRAQETVTTPAIQGPRIYCEQPLFDFGSADSSTTIEHTFVIQNIGDTTLEISQVRPACGCTLANITEKTIPPGGRSEITARLSLAGRNGPQSKPITILSNDPQNPEYRVTMAGTVASAIMAAPDRLMFGQIGQGQSVELMIDLTSAAERFTILGIESSIPELAVTTETIEETRHYRLKATLTGPVTPGPLSAALLVKTDNAGRPAITIPVIANIVGELIYAPAVMEIPAGSGQPITRYIVIRPGTLTDFTLKAVNLPDPSMRASIFPFGNQGYRIQVENIPTSPDLNGKTITIETSGEAMSLIEIPITVK